MIWELSRVRSLYVCLGEGHMKDEHVMFELEGGENYRDPVSDHFHIFNINILRLFP